VLEFVVDVHQPRLAALLFGTTVEELELIAAGRMLGFQLLDEATAGVALRPIPLDPCGGGTAAALAGHDRCVVGRARRRAGIPLAGIPHGAESLENDSCAKPVVAAAVSHRHVVASVQRLLDVDLDEAWRPTEYAFRLGDFESRLRFPTCKLIDKLDTEWRDDHSLPVQVARAQIEALRTASAPEGRYLAKWRLVRNLYELGYRLADSPSLIQ
jgi:hypothetical protein